jgi:hypothetical protein
MERLLRQLVLIVLAFSFTGCAALGLSKLPFAKNSQDESLRQKVEADSFPSAQQAGL